MEYVIWSTEIVALALTRSFSGCFAGTIAIVFYFGSIIYTIYYMGWVWVVVPALVAPALAGVVLAWLVSGSKK